MKKIIGIGGTNGAGKDAVANYIYQRHGYRKLSAGDILRGILKEKGKRITRASQRELQKKLLKKHGQTHLMEKIIDKIKKGRLNKYVVPSMRYPSDIKAFRKAFKKNFLAIMVDSDPRIRYKRMVKRKRADMPKSFNEFNDQDKKEAKTFNFKMTFKLIDEVIWNNTTFIDLKRKTDKVLKKKGFA